MAAGCAFYATLALIPAISVLLSVYGLVFNPHSVEAQLDVLQGLVPPEALKLISLAVHGLVQHRSRRLTASLLIGAAIMLWSADNALAFMAFLGAAAILIVVPVITVGLIIDVRHQKRSAGPLPPGPRY